MFFPFLKKVYVRILPCSLKRCSWDLFSKSYILLREMILSAKLHVAFSCSYISFYFSFFFLSTSLLFYFLFVFSLFCKLGVLVRHRISLFGKETLDKYLCEHPLIFFAILWKLLCTALWNVACLHVCMISVDL